MKKLLIGLLFAVGAWGQITTVPGGAGGVSLDGVQTLTNKTIDGVDAGAGTTRSGQNIIKIASHNTDCTSLTDGKARELCHEEDSNRTFICQPTAGDCDTPSEWILQSPEISTAWATAIAATCDATVAGKIVPVTGALVDSIECSNDSGSYEWLMHDKGRRWQIPILTDWTETAATTPATTATQHNGAISLSHPDDAAANGDYQFYHQTQPSTPYSFTGKFIHLSGNAVNTDNSRAGIGVRESTDNDYATIEITATGPGNYIWQSQLWTDNATPSTSYGTTAPVVYVSATDGVIFPSLDSAPVFYACINNDGVNRTTNYSLDGITWTQVSTETFDENLTPDQLVFGNNSDNGGVQLTYFTGFAIRTGSTTCGAF